MVSGKSLTNYQSYCQQMMFFWLIIGGGTFIFCEIWLPYQFLIFVPVISFFGTYYLFAIERKWIRELLFISILASGGIQLWSTFTPILVPIDYQKVIAQPLNNFNIKNKKIWVLGDAYNYYLNNQPATPFLDWEIAQEKFSNTNEYEVLLSLYKQIEDDKPEIIIDQQKQLPLLFKQLPIMAGDYKQIDSITYQLKIK